MIGIIKKYWLSDNSFVSQMLVLAFLVFILPVLIDEGFYNALFVQLIFLTLFLSSLFYEYKNKLIWVALVLLGSQVYLFVKDFFTNDETNFLFNPITLLNIVFFIYLNLKLLFRDKSINLYRIVGAINIYLLIAVYGALCVGFIHQLKGNSIQGNFTLAGNEMDYGEYMYFSLTSLSTVGYGDTVAVNMAVKMLGVFLSATGILFPVIVVARLVSMVDKTNTDDKPA